MKKLFVLSIAILLAFAGSAQKFGVKAGYGMSGYLINFYSPAGSGMSTGFNAGLVAELDLKVFGIRADLTFNQLGANYDSRNEVDADWALRALGVEYNYNQNINYLNLGVSAKKSFGPVYVALGPYFGYAINGNQTSTWEGGPTLFSPTPGTGTLDIFSDPNTNFNPLAEYTDTNNQGGSGDLYKKTDLGVNLGLGASFSGIFVEVNAGLGLLNFINTGSTKYSAANYATKDDKTVPITGDASMKNLGIGLSVGYMFGK
jgi:hypothetical protein